MDNVKNLILMGELSPDEKLPSVRSLARELGINPNTIQRAYRLLEFDGWIATIPGKGCFVSRNQKALQQEIDRCYAGLDEAAANLLALGITTEEIIEHLKKRQIP